MQVLNIPFRNMQLLDQEKVASFAKLFFIIGLRCQKVTDKTGRILVKRVFLPVFFVIMKI